MVKEQMIKEIRSNISTAIISAICTVLVWGFLAGGTVAKTDTRLSNLEIRMNQNESDVRELKNLLMNSNTKLDTLIVEQRLLHGMNPYNKVK